MSSLDQTFVGKREPRKEFLSHSLNYKALIETNESASAKKTYFQVSVYAWRQKGNRNDEEIEAPVWERVGGPFVLDSWEEAEKAARENLQLLSGEVSDQNVSSELTTWLRKFTGDENAEFLEGKNFRAQILKSDDSEKERYVESAVTRIAVADGLYLVEVEKRWLLGILRESGMVRCWGSFSSLEEAIRELQAGNGEELSEE